MLRPDELDRATRPFINRAPWTGPDNTPRSVMEYGPAELLPDSETATQWSPYFYAIAQPYRGGHDELSLEGHGLMSVAQADLYDSSPNGWPQNSQFDHPNAIGMIGAVFRLKPHTSAHPGFTMSTKRGDPTSLFHAPPIFGLQTQPVPAVGV